MDFKQLLKRGLLGYQPIFFPNGVITGTGYQFFGNIRRGNAPNQDRPVCSEGIAENESSRFNPGQLGNLYIPPSVADRDSLNSDFYYRIDDGELPLFVRDNLLLKRVYEYYVKRALAAAIDYGCPIASMLEVGSNTCLFPVTFSRAGVAECHGADIVDYSDVVSILSAMNDVRVDFHHMPDDSDETWRTLPKVDLVWSHAVLLHQSNPLAHLTRLAAHARRAIFVMTNCGSDADWGAPDDMAVKFLSANSYYAASFPNCFDVTIVSPALIRFSLQRLGFSKIIEIPCPEFDHGSEIERANFEQWMTEYRCFLAFRDEAASDDALDDHSVESERSPYNGDEVCAHRGFHHNVFLKNGRYFVVPHGCWVGQEHARLRSFGSLSRAVEHLQQQEQERNPFPVLVEELDGHVLLRYRNRFYLCPAEARDDFVVSGMTETLHSLDSRDKWRALLARISIDSMRSQAKIVVDLVGDVCLLKTEDGCFDACRLDGDHWFGEVMVSGHEPEVLRRRVVTEALLASLTDESSVPQAVFSDDGKSVELVAGGLVVRELGSGRVLSEYSDHADGWREFLSLPK